MGERRQFEYRQTPEENRYDSELMSLIIIALVSAAGKFWYIFMIVGMLGVLSAVGVLVCELFVRGMAWNMSRMDKPRLPWESRGPGDLTQVTVPSEAAIGIPGRDQA